MWRALFLLLSMFSVQAYAVDLSYRIYANGSYVQQSDGATPAIVCANAPTPAAVSGGYAGVLMGSSPSWTCRIRRISDGYIAITVGVNILGAGCTAPKVYNPVTFGCEAPAVVCPVGDLFPAKGADGTVVTSSTGVNYVAGSDAPTMCQGQCLYAPSGETKPVTCYGTAGGVGWCNYVIKSTGANCSADNYAFAKSGPQLNPSDTPNVPESTAGDPLCPKGWSVSNGTCFKNPVDPLNPPPETGTAGNETGGTGTAGGGSGSSGESAGATDDLADAVGDTSGDTVAPPCVPKADGTGCGVSESTVRGADCDKPLQCTGDAVQCAALNYQKQSRCAEIYDVPAQNFVKAQISKDEYQLEETDISTTSLFTDGTSAGRWLPSACPAPKSFSITGVSTSLSMQPACDAASALGPLFVALASLFFAVYVGRSFGGG